MREGKYFFGILSQAKQAEKWEISITALNLILLKREREREKERKKCKREQ